jgi:hypothetical protein
LKELHATYGEKVEFLVVYITEAHALDGASPKGGADGSPIVEEPTTLEERRAIAHRCDIALGLAPMTVLLDNMKNTAGAAYVGHPDRLYLVDKEGRISFVGEKGPRGFDPDALEDAIRVDLEMPAIERKKGSSDRRRRR